MDTANIVSNGYHHLGPNMLKQTPECEDLNGCRGLSKALKVMLTTFLATPPNTAADTNIVATIEFIDDLQFLKIICKNCILLLWSDQKFSTNYG